MDLNSLFGLPAHPLVVHVAVVLLPLSAIGAIACLKRSVRDRIGPIVAGLAIVSMLAVGAAQSSGESLGEKVPETALVSAHEDMGNRVLPWAFLLAGSITVLVGLDYVRRWMERDDEPTTSTRTAPSWYRPVLVAASVLVVISALGSTITVIEVGHSGAKATWDKVASQPTKGG
jgi:hypothetical protein